MQAVLEYLKERMWKEDQENTKIEEYGESSQNFGFKRSAETWQKFNISNEESESKIYTKKVREVRIYFVGDQIMVLIIFSWMTAP